MQQRTGYSLTWNQMNYVQRKNLKQHVKDIGHRDFVTAADRLLYKLEHDISSSFIALFGEKNSDLITIKQKKKKKNLAVEIDEFHADLDDPNDSPLNCAATFRDRLQYSKTGEILLAIAWCSDESRRKFDMYPEIIGADDTEETNSEERPLFTLCGKDGNNQIFTILNCFMPSRSRWVFSWILKIALPNLHMGSALTRVNKVNSDASPQEINAIDAVVGNDDDTLCQVSVHHKYPRIMPNAKGGLCSFHQIDRNYVSHPKYKSTIAATKSLSIMARAEVDMLLRWLWYFTKHYELEEEIRLSQYLLTFYLNDEQDDHFAELDVSFRNGFKGYLTNSFFENEKKLFDAFFGGMTMGFVTTGINESWHHSIKYSVNGPRPMHDVAEAADRIIRLEEKKDVRKSVNTAFDLTATFAKSKNRNAQCYVAELTKYCNTNLFKEHGQIKKHFVYRQSDTIFYVKRDYVSHDTTPQDDLNLSISVCQRLFDTVDKINDGLTNLEQGALMKIKAKLLGDKKGNLPQYRAILYHVMKWVIPRFEHTRTVTVVKMSDGESVLTCSCRSWEKRGWACRHMYSVLRRYPKVGDAKVRWHVGYAHYYGRCEKMSSLYVRL